MSYDAVYHDTSEFIHPKIRSCLGWFFGEGEEAQFWSTKFDSARAFQLNNAIMHILGATFLCVPIIFPYAFVAEKNGKVKIELVARRISPWIRKMKELRKPAN